MTIDPETFRSVLGRFATGVTIVTVRDAEGHDCGMTVNAFCSVSLVPPLVLVCVDHSASTHDALVAATHFAINILSARQEALSRRFANHDDHKRFDGVGYSRAENGPALLDDALGHIECRRVDQHVAGDHTIVIGQVEAAAAKSGQPLLYYRGGYAQLER